MTQIKRTGGAKSKRNAVISLLLVVALLITGAFAYLTATDSKTNTFTVGNVDVELHENFDGTPDIDSDNPTIEDIVPNQDVEKEPWIENTGNSPAYVYMMVGIPKDNVAIAATDGTPLNNGAKSVQELFTLNNRDETNWTRIETSCRTTDTGLASNEYYAYNYYVYAYNAILPADDDAATDSIVEDITTSLFDSVTFKNIIDNEGGQYGPYNIPINAYAIQTSALPDGVDTAVEAWGLFAAQNGWTRTSAGDPELWTSETNTIGRLITFVDGGDVVGTAVYSDDSTDSIVVPSSSVPGWIAPSGNILPASGSVDVKDILEYEPVASGDTIEFNVVDPDPIVYSLVTVDSNSPKLMPKSGSTAAIERDGVAETYNTYTTNPYSTSVIAPSQTRYTPGANGFNKYFVYGLMGAFWYGGDWDPDYTVPTPPAFASLPGKPFPANVTTEAEQEAYVISVMDNYLEVNVAGTSMSLSTFNNSGNGKVVVEYKSHETNAGVFCYTGTGYKISLFDANNNLIEQFRMVVTADGNGDGRITAPDTSLARSFAFGVDRLTQDARASAWVKAFDTNHDGVISRNDNAANTDITDDINAIRNNIAGTAKFDDTNQTVSVWSY